MPKRFVRHYAASERERERERERKREALQNAQAICKVKTPQCLTNKKRRDLKLLLTWNDEGQ